MIVSQCSRSYFYSSTVMQVNVSFVCQLYIEVAIQGFKVGRQKYLKLDYIGVMQPPPFRSDRYYLFSPSSETPRAQQAPTRAQHPPFP